MPDTLKTPLYPLHERLGASMAAFAGWALPMSYPAGTIAEHKAARSGAALFDVSHMGQVEITGDGAAEALERLMPQDVVGLKDGRQIYGFLTTEDGGILDDLMVSREGDVLRLVVNAAFTEADLDVLRQGLPEAEVRHDTSRALIAVQGPDAEDALAAHAPEVRQMRFMDAARSGSMWITRSGYTGEDGFEISIPAGEAEALASALVQSGVQPAGLGARDSLRLEAGLCLSGTDIGPGTSPAEAGLKFAIPKVRRRDGARAGGFPGATRILAELTGDGPARLRMGLRPEGRAPFRAGTPIFAGETAETPFGHVTSGGHGPSVEGPVAMAYLPRNPPQPDSLVWGEVRGRRIPARIVPMPFHPHAYRR
ncbi:glycine cleavage system aminomethyltransferase GcvT [Tropicimonas sp. IMCC34011]|uniref:glycine cleavage system aminomethyltransferase GcvT n=1 Tax=Tropicimonas sp. IMCC34011 TaxID=2248759 RepID=UPI000E235C2A|nr:glycine cleavage system aminomethyltransferase GcvT [Tropicimonas sp. IMCC34011]